MLWAQRSGTHTTAMAPGLGHATALAGALWFLVLTAGAGKPMAQTAPDPQTLTASGLALPRFVSLKSDRVNLRQGPGMDYPIAWIFQRVGLPVEVIKEFESWRQVRDAEGTTGWVLASALSGRRTALILPWEAKPGQTQQPSVALRDDDSESARPVALVEAGVLASIIGCDGKWCRVSVGGYRGYVQQTKLWGAYPGEPIK
jgi:SH3-like domain-containing protein